MSRRSASWCKAHGGRVYVDGANMNALVGLAAPGQFGGDVSHLNLHKTFCIPHGGGGPGVGPVCVVEDLVPFLPGHRTARPAGGQWGSFRRAVWQCAVLPISWMYIRLMGAEGLKAGHRGGDPERQLRGRPPGGRLRHPLQRRHRRRQGRRRGARVHPRPAPLKETTGVGAEDVAKRLIDYGFHAPTLSFPVAGTLMVEPTESESRWHELDRFSTPCSPSARRSPVESANGRATTTR
jgi:glycine dehydrogenase